MSASADSLAQTLAAALGDALAGVSVALSEVTAVVSHERLIEVMRALRDRPELRFETLIDVCGVDWSAHATLAGTAPRFSAVYHLLSLSNNRRLRVRCHAPDDDFPVLPSVIDVWPSANWFERETFDLYGIVFTGHPDLRRLLTDYGFVGHPFRKDFPLSGHVEMRFDPEQGRVVYQPVTIEPREITPRIVREPNYAGGR
ncbi:MAG: NADH-quinone oxidoreductase subunit C [Burkholderiales bacterium]